jgi:hypothetical protein
MSGLQTQISDARKAGYGDDEIVQFLSQMPTVGAQVNEALKAQYQPNEILKFLSEQKSAAYEAGAKMPEAQRAFVNAMQGPTFGFMDELAGGVLGSIGAIRTGKPLAEQYTKYRDVARGAAESYGKESPFMSAGLQTAASLPLMASQGVSKAVQGVGNMAAPYVGPTVAKAAQYLAGTPAAGQVMGLGQRAVQAGASGLGYGLIGGVGSSDADSIAGITQDALKSGVVSAGLGAATQPVMAVLGAGGRQITSRVSDKAAGRYAEQKVAEALLRDTPPDLLSSALGMSQARMNKLGSEARIADVGGANTRQLLDTVATLSGETKQTLERAIRERQAGRAGRLMGAADTALGTKGADFLGSLEQFSAQRQTASRPFYDVIDKAVITVDDQLMDVLNRSKRAQGAAELLFETKTGQTLDLSKLKVGEQVPMNVLDTLKQSLYDSAQTLKRSGSGQQANAYDDVRGSLVSLLEAKSPKVGGQSAYTQAMKTWAGPSQMMDAAEAGRKALTGDIMDVKQLVKGFTPSEMDAYKIGALQALRQKTGTESGQTSLLKMWKEPATQDRLREVFGNSYRDFASSVAKEARLKGIESAGRGSQTAARLAGAADLDVAPLMQGVQAAGTGNIPAMISAGSSFMNKVQTPEPVRNEIGRILLSREQQKLLDLNETMKKLNASRAAAAGYGGYTGGQIGSNLAMPQNGQ